MQKIKKKSFNVFDKQTDKSKPVEMNTQMIESIKNNSELVPIKY